MFTPHTGSDSPPFDSAKWYERPPFSLTGVNASIQTEITGDYMCIRGWWNACSLWGYYLTAAGGEYDIDPDILFKEDNFSRDVEDLRNQLLANAVGACDQAGASTCKIQFDSKWQDTLETSKDDPVIEDFAWGFGKVRMRISGSMTIEKEESGRVSYEGTYDLEIGKDWNFDLDKAPEIRGVELSLEAMRVLPKYGYAREFFVTGNRSYDWAGSM